MNKSARYILMILLILVAVVCATALAGCNKPDCDIEIDCTESQGEIMHGATGFLYGLAEPDVPSGQLLGTLFPQIAAVKAPDGTQHPMGDVLKVGTTFIENGGDRLFVYMQDIYPDWYYVYKGIDDYLAKIDEMMPKLVAYEYASKIIYCPFNENDNGEWYGSFKLSNNRKKFFNDWKAAYDKIKAYDPLAQIAGPGFMKYNKTYIKDFLKFCKSNDCIPDMTVWHELGGKSYRNYEKNFNEYRSLERELGIPEIEICISEYGEMSSNGLPGEMVQFISMFENTKANACIAYWRLANNLSELAADNNTPAASWWVYHWYGQMSGNTYRCNVRNKSDMRAVASYDGNKGKIEILVGDGEGSQTVKLRNIKNLPAFTNAYEVCINIEYVDFAGLGGECLSPSLYSRKAVICSDEISIQLQQASKYRAYKITVTEASGDISEAESDFAKRYEAEVASGKTKKVSVIKKPTYAASGSLVKGVTSANKLNFEIDAPSDGKYLIKVCYANGYSTDGNSEKRANVDGYIEVDGVSYGVSYENTLSDITTAMKCIAVDMTAGKHTVSLFGDTNIAYDFIDVVSVGNFGEPYVFEQEGRLVTTAVAGAEALMFVVPSAGYYCLTLDDESEILFRDTRFASAQSRVLYMEKGINFIYLDEARSGRIIAMPQMSANPIVDVKYSDGIFATDERHVCGVDNYVELKINVEDGGLYALNLVYASNEQIGEHAYNVQQVERCAVLETNGVKQTIYFRSTYSWETYLVKTVYVTLTSGENIIKLYNDGAYVWNGNIPYMPVFDYGNITYAKAQQLA